MHMLLTLRSSSSVFTQQVTRQQCCSVVQPLVSTAAYSKARRGQPGARSSRSMSQGQGAQQKKTFTVAIEGCCHGELDNIYATLEYMQKAKGKKVDLLICCGDFQAVRNLDDMETMSIPLKYRQIMTFYKYYSGEKVAPIPTLFIGGNHEASNYLRELFYGGWAAPNIYFLGFAGCVQFGGHRIAGLSGTYVQQHYQWGHHERLPYDDKAIKSIYHVRQQEMHKLMQLQGQLSMFLSHDWPNLITSYGDKARLFRNKPYFQKEAERGDLGSPPNQQLLEALQPDYWFAAHLHCKFAAVVPHNAQNNGSNQQQQQGSSAGPGQFALPGVPAAAAAGPAAAAAGGDAKVTRFLALDKCLPNRDFLQLVELDVQGPLELCYDPEWLAVLRSTHSLYSNSKYGARLPHNWGERRGASPEDVAFVTEALQKRGGNTIPQNFAPTAPAYDPQSRAKRGNMPRVDLQNPQTLELLQMLGLSYNLDSAVTDSMAALSYVHQAQQGGAAGGGGTHYRPQTSLLSQQQRNPEEIDLDSDEDEEAGGAAQHTAAAAAAGGGVAGEEEEEEEPAPPGGALADGAPDSDDEAAAAAAAADEGGGGGGGAAAGGVVQQRLDDPMFGEVNTARFPYYTKD